MRPLPCLESEPKSGAIFGQLLISAALKWPAHERFTPHRHFGGEEIFVLSGVFRDEWGTYPTGAWIRNPHLSQHHPFVEEETVILVKVGHLPEDLTN